MASWQARVAAFLVRRTIRPALGDMRDLVRVRKAFSRPMPPPRGARYTPATLGGVPGEWVEATQGEPQATLMYLHGGGFVGCSPVTHRAITASLARRGFRVFAPDYRLAPEHPFPAAIDDVVAVWRALRAEQQAAGGARRLVVAGDSAGGNLALALMLSLRDAGEPLPAAAALFSPVTDLGQGSPSIDDNAERDAMFHGDRLHHLADAYLAGADPLQPLASPLRGDLRGLPPLLVHVGAAEVLRDDSVRLADKARAAGVRVQLRVWPVVPHAWQLLWWMPEARASIGEPRPSCTSGAARGLARRRRRDRAPRRGDRGRRPVRHRRGRAPATRLSAAPLRHPRRARCHRRHLGPVPLSGRAVRLRHVHARLRVQAVARRQGDRRRAVDPRLRARDRHRARHRPPHPLRAQAGAAPTGRRPAAAGCCRSSARRAAPCGSRAASSGCAAATTATRKATARSSRARSGSADGSLHPQFWPEALDYAGKRVVVIGSGATAVTLVPEMARTAGARDDAAAVAQLRGRAARGGSARGTPEATAAGDGGVPAGAHQERPAAAAVLPHGTQVAGPDRQARDAARGQPAAARLRHAPTSPRATTPGTSACAWCRMPTCSARSPTARPRSSPTRSRPSPSAASASHPAASWRRTSSSPRPGCS